MSASIPNLRINSFAIAASDRSIPDELNRDISNANVVTEDKAVGGLNANLSVDTRLFSEEGRKDVGKDFKQSSILTDALIDALSEESVGVLDINDHIKNRNRFFEANIEFAKNNPELAKALNDPNAEPSQKQEALTAYANAISERFGITRDEAVLLVANAYEETIGGSFKGAYAKGEGTIFINDLTNDSAIAFANTTGHEETHYLQDRSIIEDKGSQELNERYADILGNASGDYFSFGYSYADLGEIKLENNNNHIGTNPNDYYSIVSKEGVKLVYTPNPNLDPLIYSNNLAYEKAKQDGEMEYLAPLAIPLGKATADLIIAGVGFIATKTIVDKAINDESNFEFVPASEEFNQPLPGFRGEGAGGAALEEFPSTRQDEPLIITTPTTNDNRPIVEIFPKVDEQAGAGLYLNDGKQDAREISAERSQLQHSFKHAGDFGIIGSANNQTLAAFEAAIQKHIQSEETQVIQGTYRGQPVTHFLNPTTGLNVMKKPSGEFWSGWKLSEEQLMNLRSRGSLQ
jgi:hypothetical protein